MIYILALMLGIISSATVIVAVEYYRRLRSAKAEYLKARGAVEDIVLSFNRELKREAQRLELVAYKIEEVAAVEGKTLNRFEGLENQIQALQSQQVPKTDIDALANRSEEAYRRICDLAASQESFNQKITAFEQQARQISTPAQTPTGGMVPIRRDRAVGRLTETEITALEFLVASEAKTAPEIREQVKLSREHTARLMKKLYEEGYLERDTSKIPFKYSVKKEMEKLLKKPEAEASASP
jgi:CRP-like cAMP-binding protein